MAMTNSGMSAAIKTEIQAIPGISITDEQELENFCDAVGKAIVEYIQANADVTAGLPPPIGLNVGGSPVSGTGKVL